MTPNDIIKNNEVKEVLTNMTDYKDGDPVGLYLKGRGITKHSPDTKIVYKYKNKSTAAMISPIYEYKKDNYHNAVGFSLIFLTKNGERLKIFERDGIKLDPPEKYNKIQRILFDKTVSGNPVRLQPRGKNNGFIYVTEGVENGLSLQEYINNEVWCSLSLVNIPTLPFEDDKVYIIVFDNDLNKIDKDGNKIGVQNLERKINKLAQLKNKHIFYLLPEEDGKDTNDLLREELKIENGKLKITPAEDSNTTTKLQDLLLNKQPIAIQTLRIVRTNKGEQKQGFRPVKPHDLEIEPTVAKQTENNNFPFSIFNSQFLSLPYDSEGLAQRFIARYGHLYRNVKNIGICKYNNGVHDKECDNELFADIGKP
jgi:hypothetical protein